MKKVIAYCRVSTGRQAEEDKFGLPWQKDVITKYCLENDMEITDWYIDEGESGVKESRPEFDRILYGEVKNPPIEAVICAKSDRIAREIKLYFYYKHLLYQKNIELCSVSEDFGDMGAFAPILEAFVMFAAEQERTNITKRTSGGRRMKAEKGGYSGGKTPYGYIAKQGKLVIEPNEAEIVRVIFNLRDDGVVMLKIVDYLNEHGYKTRKGKEFVISTVQSILNNRKTYEGYYKYGKDSEWVKGEQEAILNYE